MNRISLALACSVFAVGASIAPLSAADYAWTFTSGGLDIHGTLTTDSAAGLAGNIVGMTGLVNGDGITKIVPTDPIGQVTSAADGQFTFDNKLNPAGIRFVDDPGILFMTASGTEYNLYSVVSIIKNGIPTPGYNLDASLAKSYGVSLNGDFSIVLSSVPEPTSWIMMLSGFAVLGTMIRSQKLARSAV